MAERTRTIRATLPVGLRGFKKSIISENQIEVKKFFILTDACALASLNFICILLPPVSGWMGFGIFACLRIGIRNFGEWVFLICRARILHG